MLLSAYIKLSRCSKQLSIPATACELAFARSFASAAEGKGAPRWYKEVNVVPDNEEGQYIVMLDRRPLRTPSKKLMSLPSYPLALAVASEWQRQEWRIRPFTMPLMTLATTAIDQPKPREGVIENLLRFLHTDVLTCRHEEDEVADEQEKLYGPLVSWLSKDLGTEFEINRSIFGAQQSQAATETMRSFLQGLSGYELAGVDSASANCKSLLLAVALFKGGLPVQDAVKFSRLEDDLQLKDWGYVEGGHDIDESETKIRIMAASVFMRLLKIVR